MKSLLLLMIGLFIGSSLYAQFHLISKEALNEVREKKLLVELKGLNTNLGSEMDNASKESYKKFVETYNEAIQAILPNNWVLSNGEAEFKSPEEIAQFSNDDLNDYILFHSGWLTKSSQTQGNLLMYSFNIEYNNSKGKRIKIFELAYVPDELISKSDIIFMTKVLNNHIKASEKYKKYKEYCDEEKNIKLLKNNTLLLDNQFTELSLEDAQNAYGSKIEIVNPEIIASEIEKESEGHVFIKLIWANNNMAMYNAFDTKDCRLVSSSGTGGMKVKYELKEGKYRDQFGRASNFYEDGKYPYRNPNAGKIKFSIPIYKSKLLIKKIHLKVISKGKF